MFSWSSWHLHLGVLFRLPSGGLLCLVCVRCVSSGRRDKESAAAPALGCDQTVWLADWKLDRSRGYTNDLMSLTSRLSYKIRCWVHHDWFNPVIKRNKQYSVSLPLMLFIARWLWTHPPSLMRPTLSVLHSCWWRSMELRTQCLTAPHGTQIWLAHLNPCKQSIIIHEK